MATAVYDSDYAKANDILAPAANMAWQIAHAIAGERERCAQIAESAAVQSYSPHEHPERIAAAIRNL